MSDTHRDVDRLLELAACGDGDARQQLLAGHRERLRRMVAVRMDRRISGRIDASDVVQESLAEAAAKLDGYLRDRPIPSYPWLRQFACQRLSKLRRGHLGTQRRGVGREVSCDLPLSGESGEVLADRLAAVGPSPSRHMMQAELKAAVHAALARLRETDREVLVLRHLEQLSIAEIAATLGVSEAAAKKRHVRALERLRAELGGPEHGAPR